MKKITPQTAVTKKKSWQEELLLPPGVTAQLHGSVLKLTGAQGEIEKVFRYPFIGVLSEGNKIILTALRNGRRERTIIGSFAAHITNMIKGVQEPHTYTLKICSGHFPMSVSTSATEFTVKNFLGESVPRIADVIPHVTIKVNDKEIIVKSVDKEAAGQMAARIEQLCRITNRDIRIFMDGIWIINKCGRNVAT